MVWSVYAHLRAVSGRLAAVSPHVGRTPQTDRIRKVETVPQRTDSTLAKLSLKLHMVSILIRNLCSIAAQACLVANLPPAMHRASC